MDKDMESLAVDLSFYYFKNFVASKYMLLFCLLTFFHVFSSPDKNKQANSRWHPNLDITF